MNLARGALDCVAAEGHKWICAPEGTGFMAVSDRLLDRLRPIELGWKSILQPDRYDPYEFHVRHDAAKLAARSFNLLGERGREDRRDGSTLGIVCFRPCGAPERVRQELWARGLVCNARLGGLRVAPHHYQDGRDVEGALC